jgi:hypothetical protein
MHSQPCQAPHPPPQPSSPAATRATSRPRSRAANTLTHDDVAQHNVPKHVAVRRPQRSCRSGRARRHLQHQHALQAQLLQHLVSRGAVCVCVCVHVRVCACACVYVCACVCGGLGL